MIPLNNRDVIVSGAGVSVSAGLATYRDEGGIWTTTDFERKSHARQYGNYLSELKPLWLSLEQINLVGPTKFHCSVSASHARVITQNVDGLHSLVGSKDVVEVYGNIFRWRKLKQRNNGFIDWREAGSLDRVRPDIVLFGEKPRNVQLAVDLIRCAERVVFVGTSGSVFPVAEWTKYNNNCFLIDPKPWSDLSGFADFVQLSADEWASGGLLLPKAN